jgi:hypothetical protein
MRQFLVKFNEIFVLFDTPIVGYTDDDNNVGSFRYSIRAPAGSLIPTKHRSQRRQYIKHNDPPSAPFARPSYHKNGTLENKL